jgi:acyl-coenzyme A thioesterase PaaI-like protein
MSVFGSAMNRLLPSVDGPKNLVREMWDRVSPMPAGRLLFSKLVGQAAPYTGSMGARVVELRRGYSEVILHERRKVRNHLKCVHAIALANLAEMTGNVALAYGMPDDARFIVAGLSIEYLKKARGTITATCESPTPETNARTEYDVLVVMRDAGGDEVARCTLRTLVGPKPGA